MKDWIKAINPMSPIANEAEALRAARASALAIVIGVIVGIIGVVQLHLKKAEIAAAVATASTQNPEAASVAAVMPQIMFYAAIGLVVVQVLFALFQWAKPNTVIPILFAVLVAGGLVLTLVIPQPEGAVSAPAWQFALGIVVAVVQFVLHIAGARGASKLDKIRFKAANADF